MDSETIVMAPKKTSPKVISINIVRGSELSEVTRAKEGLSKDDLVEIRVERDSPATPKLIKLGKNQSPVSRFKNALEKEGFLGKNII